MAPHPNIKRNKSKLPYAYTEQGIAMLSALLKSEIAISVSVNIMKAFIEMRKFILNNGQVFERLTNIEYKMLEYDKKFEEVFNQLGKGKQAKQSIFFKGQIYDSYELIIDIIKTAQNKILIIDNYIDDTVLKMLQKKNNCGASLKDLGKKCFAISKIEDDEILKKIKENSELI